MNIYDEVDALKHHVGALERCLALQDQVVALQIDLTRLREELDEHREQAVAHAVVEETLEARRRSLAGHLRMPDFASWEEIEERVRAVRVWHDSRGWELPPLGNTSPLAVRDTDIPF